MKAGGNNFRLIDKNDESYDRGGKYVGNFDIKKPSGSNLKQLAKSITPPPASSKAKKSKPTPPMSYEQRTMKDLGVPMSAE